MWCSLAGHGMLCGIWKFWRWRSEWQEVWRGEGIWEARDVDKQLKGEHIGGGLNWIHLGAWVNQLSSCQGYCACNSCPCEVSQHNYIIPEPGILCICLFFTTINTAWGATQTSLLESYNALWSLPQLGMLSATYWNSKQHSINKILIVIHSGLSVLVLTMIMTLFNIVIVTL